MDGRLRLARTVIAVALLLFVANCGYGLAHEAAHAAVIDALGGHVYGIYVNVFGTDAYTEHTVISDTADLVLVNVAGTLHDDGACHCLRNRRPEPAGCVPGGEDIDLRAQLRPGTDISTIYATVGSLSVALSLLIVAVNLACICYAVKGKNVRVAAATKRFIAGLSSS